MDNNMKDFVLLVFEMVEGHINIEMVAYMKVSGREDLKKVTEYIITKMGIFIQVNGNKELNMDRENTYSKRLEKNIKEAGKMDRFMERVLFAIKMVLNMMAIGQKEKDMVKVHFILIKQNIQAYGKTIN